MRTQTKFVWLSDDAMLNILICGLVSRFCVFLHAAQTTQLMNHSMSGIAATRWLLHLSAETLSVCKWRKRLFEAGYWTMNQTTVFYATLMWHNERCWIDFEVWTSTTPLCRRHSITTNFDGFSHTKISWQRNCTKMLEIVILDGSDINVDEVL